MNILKYKSKIIFYVVILLIVGCKSQLQKSKELNFDDKNFNSNLSKYYANFATQEAEKYDWFDSEYFAKKAINASHNMNIPPENPKDWQIKDSFSKKEVMSAYNKLNLLLNDKNKNLYPVQLARAQANYDCWVEELEEGWQKDDIKMCKDNFFKFISEINNSFAPKVNNKLIVFYEFNETELNDNQILQIKKFIKSQNTRNNCAINIEGHADYTGSKEHNDKISLIRAQKVSKVINSIKSKKIIGYGYKKYLVKTEKGVRRRRIEGRKCIFCANNYNIIYQSPIM